MNQVHSAINAVDTKVATVGQQVLTVSTAQQETRSDLAQLRDEFLRFVRQAEFTANLQRAETKLGSLQDALEHQFGHHKVVRRSAVGILQAFDSGLVSQEAIRGIGEQLMIQSPRYWLAPTLVALSAWKSDDSSLCERAVAEAFRRSPDRTSLFFALVLRRQGRQDGAVRWLRHYLGAQSPTELGRDFAVILESISQGAFGPAGLELVQDTLSTWRETLLNDDAVQAAQVKLWRSEVERFVQGPSRANFPHLADIAPQWPQLETTLQRAEAHGPLHAHYSEMMNEEPAPSDRIEDAVDDILDRLVSEYDTEELPIKRELDRNKAIVEHNGDITAAEAVSKDNVAFEAKLDYLTIQSTSALRPSDIGVSRATQRLSVAACSEWLARAHEQFTAEYRKQLPQDVEAVFENSHNVGAKTFNLPRWSGSFVTPMPQLESSLSSHWDAHGKKVVDSLAFDWQKAAIFPGVVMLAVLVFGVAINPLFGILATLIGGGIWALVIYQRAQGALKSQEEARATIQKFKQQSLTQLREAGAELADWTTRYKTAEYTEPGAREMIKSLSSISHMSTQFTGRSVHVTRGF